MSSHLAGRIAKLEKICGAKELRMVIRFVNEEGIPCPAGAFPVPTEQQLAEASRVLTIEFVGS